MLDLWTECAIDAAFCAAVGAASNSEAGQSAARGAFFAIDDTFRDDRASGRLIDGAFFASDGTFRAGIEAVCATHDVRSVIIVTFCVSVDADKSSRLKMRKAILLKRVSGHSPRAHPRTSRDVQAARITNSVAFATGRTRRSSVCISTRP